MSRKKLDPRLTNFWWMSEAVVTRSTGDIAKELGCSPRTVRRFIPWPYQGLRLNERKVLYDLMKATARFWKKDTGHIAKRLGMSAKDVYHACKKLTKLGLVEHELREGKNYWFHKRNIPAAVIEAANKIPQPVDIRVILTENQY